MLTRAVWIAVVASLAAAGVAHAQADASAARIFMPDGQLKSHAIRVYVSRDLGDAQQPRLRLLRSHAVTKAEANEEGPYSPRILAAGQEWVENVDGQDVRRTGTILMFDLGNLDFHGKAMIRVRPVVTWTDAGAPRVAVGDRDVNVGNIVGAILWTLLVVAIAVALVVLGLAWRAGRGHPLRFLAGVDGHLSLAQTQIACWTVVVGAVVLGYGFVRLEIPTIPSSVVALMGLSLATGGIGYFQDAKNLAPPAPGTTRAPRVADLIRVAPWGPDDLSLAKAQMVFWTVLLLTLFISKSVLDGVIWDIPWAMVSLMGFSQAGYLAPKLAA